MRGTTGKRRIMRLRECGAKEIHMRISCPPVAHPCFYGIDFPTREELIGSNNTVEEIREFVGADSLGYLSPDGLLAPLKANQGFCRACFTGDYPLDPGAGNRSKYSLEVSSPELKLDLPAKP